MKIICLALLLGLVFSTNASEDSWSAKVEIKISADSELKSEIESYVKRELRDLHDISLTEDSTAADYRISIVAIPLQSKSGIQTGYALSTVITCPLKGETMMWVIFASGGDTNKLPGLSTNFTEYVTIEDHNLLITDPDHLKSTCEKLVANMDADCFEPARQSYDRMMTMIEDFKKHTQMTRSNVLEQSFIPPKTNEIITNSP
jgi:hypothetical protein